MPLSTIPESYKQSMKSLPERNSWLMILFNQSGGVRGVFTSSPEMKRATSRCPFPSGVLSYTSSISLATSIYLFGQRDLGP